MTSLRMRIRRELTAFAGVIALGVLAGCVHPERYNGITPNSADTTYACTIREAAALGYRVTFANKDTGLVEGDREGPQHGPSNMGHVDHDRLTVLIVGQDSTSHLHVTAETVRAVTFALHTNLQSIRSTEAVRGDALRLLKACAPSGVMVKATGGARHD